MSANLPILWNDKINSKELQAFLAQYGPEYCFSAEEINQLRDAVNEMAVVQQSTFMGTVEPGDTPTGTGNRYWTAITPATYPNHGNKVVADNSLAIISVTAAGVWSVSQTAFNISGKVNVSDVVNNLTSDSEVDPVSALQAKILNDKFKETVGVNLFDKNNVLNGFVLRVGNELQVNAADWITTKQIKIKPSTNYFLSHFESYGVYDINMTEIAYVAPFNNASAAIVTGATAAIIRFTVREFYINTTQLNLGTTAVDYVPYLDAYYNLDGLDNEIFFNPLLKPIEDTIKGYFVQTFPDNIFNKTNVTKNAVLRAGNTIQTDMADWVTSNISEIKPSTNYFISKYGAYGIYDKDGNELVYVAPFSESNSAITTSPLAKYIRITARIWYVDFTQIKEGVADSAYTPFSETLYDKNKDGVEIFFNPAPEKIKEFAGLSYLFGKNWLALGDSITFRDNYTQYVKKALGLNSYTNKGVSGRQVAQFINERNETDGTALWTEISPAVLNAHDIISFCGFANNYGGSSVMGTINDVSGGVTFYSQVKTVIEYLCTNAPDKLIVGIGALQLKGYFTGDFGTVNLEGKTTFDYNEAMRLTCELYGIPFVDLYRNGGVNKYNADSFYTSPDYIHPNDTGGMQKMGRLIAAKFRELSEKIV